MKIKTQPFTTPNYVLQEAQVSPRTNGWHGLASFPLSEFTPDELSTKCDEFRAEVFRKAGKADPRSNADAS